MTLTAFPPLDDEESSWHMEEPVGSNMSIEKASSTFPVSAMQRLDSGKESDLPSTSPGTPGSEPVFETIPPRTKTKLSTTTGGSSRVETMESTIARIKTVLDNVPHDDFAAEFIKDAGFMSERAIIEAMNEEAEFRPIANPETPVEDIPEKKEKEMDSKHFPRSTQTSIKIVYTPPVWPHHTPLYETLSKLPALRSLILDDSKVRWLR
jgi:hypothetical protein